MELSRPAEDAPGADAIPVPVTGGPEGRPRLGRPRSEECDRAIETAALELLVEGGVGRITMEGIACRAGVGKATVYRRWGTKEDLIVDAVTRTCPEHVVVPDTGSVRDDMLEVLRSLLARLQCHGPVMLAFTAEQGRHPELAETFRRTFLAERRAATREILVRGVERGELAADADIDLLNDAGPALLWYRLAVTGAHLDDDLPARIVDQLFGRC